MITKDDIDAFEETGLSDNWKTTKAPPLSPLEYSYWVENKILTDGQDRLVENTLGLVGEAGEVAEKIKKYIRDGNKVNQAEIVKELGDVVFYVAALSNYFYSNLEEVLDKNVDKLDSRQERGKLQGSGDNR